MVIAALFAPVVGWVFREVVVKFVVFSAVFALVAYFAPKAVAIIQPFIGGGSLSSAFAGLGSNVWFFLDFFRLDLGAPLLISAFIARFLIRRLPVIG